MKYPKHEDERGYFQELSRQSEDNGYINVEQISWFSINPGQIRGGHYHKKTQEKFILLEGDCKVTLSSVLSEDGWVEQFVMKPGDSFFAETYMVHTFRSKDGCKFLVLSNQEFNPNDADTFYEK